MNATRTSATRRARTTVLAGVILVSLAPVAVGVARAASSQEPTATTSTGRSIPTTSADVADNAADLRNLHRQGEIVDPGADTGSWSSMQEFLEYVIHDADRFWTRTLTAQGSPEPQVQYLFPGPGVVEQTLCGATDDSSMFYCPASDQIVFSQQLARDLWSGTYRGPDGQTVNGPVGDFATAVMVAHEFAHSIQAELGIIGGSGARRFEVPRTEKHADCWAGVWANSAYHRQILDPNDINEGLIAAFLVGDSHIESADHHGTSAQRQAAFMLGYNSGSPIACDTYLLS